MGSSPLSTILLIALMVVAFYFLLLRPQKKRQQAQQKTMSEIQPGTRVLLGSGIFGTVISVGAKQAILETSPGVQVTVLKQAIARIIQPGDEFSEPEEFETDLDEESVVDPDPVEPRDTSEPRNPSEPRDPFSSHDDPTFGNEPKKD